MCVSVVCGGGPQPRSPSPSQSHCNSPLLRSLRLGSLSLECVCVSVKKQSIGLMDLSVSVCVNLLSVMMMIRGCLIPG